MVITERLIVKLLAAVFQEHGSEDMLDKLLSEVEAMDCLARLVPAKFEPAESSDRALRRHKHRRNRPEVYGNGKLASSEHRTPVLT